MSLQALRIFPEVLRSVAAATIPATFPSLVGAIGGPFLHPIRILQIVNQTNGNVLISWDGIDAHIFLGTQDFILLDICTNKSTPNGAFIAQGTTIYAAQSGAAPTTGSVYVSAFYGVF
jgi:hypothetical protein